MMVIGMALVTYIPRMFPLAVLPGIKLPRFLKSFLSFVPIAVLSALIFPGILNSTGNIHTALIGGGVAMILAFNKVNLMVVVLGSIFTVFISGIIL